MIGIQDQGGKLKDWSCLWENQVQEVYGPSLKISVIILGICRPCNMNANWELNRWKWGCIVREDDDRCLIGNNEEAGVHVCHLIASS